MKPIYNIGAYEIQQYQKNRYPWFFVDKITEVMPGEYSKGFKNFTYNEWFFPAHFVDEPNVPGTVQIESLIQVFLMTFLTIPEYKGKKTGDVELSHVKFKKEIVPGDRMDIEAWLVSFRRGIAKGHAEGSVGGGIACGMDLVVAIPDVLDRYKPRKNMGDILE